MIRRAEPAHSARFARYLLHAIGFGTAAAASVPGCGGVVHVDEDAASGDAAGAGGESSGTEAASATTGVGGASTSTSTTGVGAATSGVTTGTSTGSGPTPSCDAELGIGEELLYGCLPLPSAGCPDKTSPIVWQELATMFAGLGCGGFNILDVPCGPDASQPDACCYHAQGYVLECGGRPFVVEGSARTAYAVPRSDWSRRPKSQNRSRTRPVAPRVSALSATARETLAEAWTRDARDEHASIASFARFVLELLAVGAPSELVQLAQRAMGDEIRHAELCFDLAGAYAGAAVGPSSLATHDALTMRTTLEDVAVATVREGCVGETVAAFLAAAARDAATEPAVRAALDVIARDEAAHAALAWRTVAWAIGRGDPGVRTAVRRAFDEILCCEPMPERGSDDVPLAAHGQLPAATRAALVAQALAEVVRPCARALLESCHRSGVSARLS